MRNGTLYDNGVTCGIVSNSVDELLSVAHETVSYHPEKYSRAWVVIEGEPAPFCIDQNGQWVPVAFSLECE